MRDPRSVWPHLMTLRPSAAELQHQERLTGVCVAVAPNSICTGPQSRTNGGETLLPGAGPAIRPVGSDLHEFIDTENGGTLPCDLGPAVVAEAAGMTPYERAALLIDLQLGLRRVPAETLRAMLKPREP